MRRLMTLLVVVLTLILASACGGTATPEGAAEQPGDATVEQPAEGAA
jgi:hypothetical protein